MNEALRAAIAEREAIIATMKEILIQDLHVQRSPEAIDVDAPLFGTGLALDSVDALELVVSCEEAFAIRLPQDALRSSLRTLDTLTDLVLAMRAEAT